MNEGDFLPETFEEAMKMPGARLATEEEAREFLKNLPPTPLSNLELVDCTRPENNGKRCHASKCYNGQRVVTFCASGRCQRPVFYNC